MPEKTYYKTLVDRYTSKKASDDELTVFFELLKEGKLDTYLSESFLGNVGVENVPVETEAPIYSIAPPKATPARISGSWMKIAAAACIAAIFATGVYFYLNNRNEPQKNIAVVDHLPSTSQDIQPGGNRATLTLADGSSIMLDKAGNGQLAEQGSLKIIKLDGGRLEYQGNSPMVAESELAYNTVSTPRGGQYQVTLPDGTKVWLNAASSIHYPTAFSGKERVVELEGECYFEVAHNSKMPFRVKMNRGVNIRVMGTHFNVHGYADEPINTTLLEGSIKIDAANGSAVLKPGQSATVKNSGDLNVVKNADVDQAVAWKNGLFQFNRADMTTVMRQIERWYDVDVEYEGKIPEKEFVGKVSRGSNISEVLQILELSKIHFKIEGKKITVMP